MPAATLRLPRFDPNDPVVIADPYPTYAALRDGPRLCRMGPASYGVPRYDDVQRLLRDPRLGNERPDGAEVEVFGGGPTDEMLARLISSTEPPRHSALRSVMSKGLDRHHIRALEHTVAERADELLMPGLDGEELDFVDQVAYPLQAAAVCALIGIDAETEHRIWPRALELGRTIIPYAVPSAADIALADAIVSELRTIVEEMINARRRTHRDDLVGRMLEASKDAAGVGALDVVDNILFLLFAGFEPSMNMIATGGSLIANHSDQYAALRDEPALVPGAVSEFLRFDAPTQFTFRMVLEEMELEEVRLRPGRILLLMLGCANHDDDRFEDAGRLDVRRDASGHVSFGAGRHHCTGAPMARLVGATLFSRLVATARTIAPAAPATRVHFPNFRAHEHVPVRLQPA